MNEKQLSLQKYLLLIRYHWKFLTICTFGGLLLGGLLNLFVIHPTYSSTAKLLIKGGQSPAFVTPLTDNTSGGGEVGALTVNGNPLLTQIQILNSPFLAKQVIDELRSTLTPKQFKQYQKEYPKYFEPDRLSGKIKFNNPANTDVVTMKLSSTDKNFSKWVVAGYVDQYQSFLEQINRQTLQQRGKYLDEQIQAIGDKLNKVRNELMLYRQQNKTIDLTNEAQVNIQELSQLQTQRITLDSQISSQEGLIRKLQWELGMNARQGLASVALGLDTTLADTQKTLNNALQNYETLSVKYTDTDPTMQALKAKIGEIRQQIQAETQRTIGIYHNNVKNRTEIADTVRSSLVNNLATAEATLKGLIAQRASLMGGIQQIRSQNQAFPDKQLHISQLLDSEKVLSQMYDVLKLKAAEAQFQASDNFSHVVVIQPATLATRPNFPAPKHILVLMTLFGMMAGLGWLMWLEWLKMQALKPIEQQLNAPRQASTEVYSV